MAHTASLPNSFRDIAADLRHLSQEADGSLSAVGERLGGIVTVLDGLTRQFDGLPRELEDEKLGVAADNLGRISRDVVAMAQALIDEGAGLSRLAALNQQMGACIMQLRKTVRAIATLAVNAQIEAAHIDARSEDFSVFAKEIIRLAKAAETTAEDYVREHEKLTDVLHEACATQAGFARTHEATLRSAGQKLETSLAAVDARRVQAAAAAAQIGERSKRIGQGISAAVMALQIGDITRQRIEHVSEALAMISAGWDETRDAEGWSSALTERQKTAVAATLCRMQSAQTVQATEEFGDEVRRVVASLTQLAEEAAAIVRFGTDTYGAADRHGGGSFLEDLQANLKLAGALMRDCQAARDQVDAVVTAVAASLGELRERLGSVRRIEVDMRLVGLNTALKCGRLGTKGRTLSVVAQELRGYANQTVQDADALMAVLRDITAAAEAFDHGRQGQGADRIGAMEREMALSLGAFEDCGKRLSRALATLVRQGGDVSHSLEEIAAGIMVHDTVGNALKTAGDRLGAMVASEPDDADAALVRERLAFFSNGRYTMASERDIHARFALGAGEMAAHAPTAAPAENSLDDILF